MLLQNNTRSTQDGDAPDIVQFTEGHFKVKIRD